MGNIETRGAPSDEIDLRKIDREHDRSDAEALRAHDRALEVLQVQHQNELASAAVEQDRGDAEAVRAHDRALEVLQVQHQNELASAAATAHAGLRAERLKASQAAEDELSKLYHEKVTEVAVASVDRARDGAKFVQTAATAVFAVYTALLALVYSVTDNPLPLRGAWAGVFLGLAIAFATAYLAFLTQPESPDLRLDNRSLVQRQFSRTANLTKWINASVHNRGYALRAAVISLLFGVLFVAAPFISTTAPTTAIPAPTAPAPPAEVAPGFEEEAQSLFEAQIEDYRNATTARAAALAAAEEAATNRKEREQQLNVWFSIAAGVALLLVLVGPGLYSAARRVWPSRRS